MPSGRQDVSNIIQCYLDVTNALSKEVEAQQLDDEILRGLNRDLNPDFAPCGYDEVEDQESDGTDYGLEEMLEFLPHTQEEFDSDEFPKQANFTTRGQSRTGSHHGRGGRRVGSGFKVRQLYRRFARLILCKRMHEICAQNPRNATKVMVSELIRTGDMKGDPEKLALKFEKTLLSTLGELSTGKHPYTVQHLPFSVLGVCARFTKADSLLLGEGYTGEACERHVVNTWLDRDCQMRCTCVGSTQYSILVENNGYHVPCCEHTETFTSIFNNLAQHVFDIPVLKGSVIYSCFSALQPDLMESLGNNIPFYSFLHRDLGAVLVCEDVDGGRKPTWIPIRRVQRKGIKYLRAFCDLINNNCCHHIRTIRRLLEGNMEETNTLAPIDAEDTGEEGETMKKTSNRGPPISFLPVAPVNCVFVLKRDQEICNLVKTNGTFILPAPSDCIHCKSPRLENTKQTNTSGVVMCTVGACRMEVHTYVCSACERRFSAEGRDDGLFIESICTAGTHALLREELIGFALGIGSLSSRLCQLHSKFSSYEDSKLFTTNPLSSKSAKTIYNMCIGLANLMVLSPPESLFFCPTCRRLDPKTGRVSVPHTVCLDGIWAGYLRKSSRAFRNVSVQCKQRVLKLHKLLDPHGKSVQVGLGHH